VGTPLLCTRSRGIFSPSGTKFALKKLDSRPSYAENPESLSLGMNRYRVETDEPTELGPAITNTRLTLLAVAPKNRTLLIEKHLHR